MYIHLKNRYECLVGGGNEFQRDDTFRPGRIGEPRQNVDSYGDVDPGCRGYHRTTLRATVGAKNRLDVQEPLRDIPAGIDLRKD